MAGRLALHRRKSTMLQMIIYGIIGIGGTICHYIVLLTLVELLNFNAVIASSMGFIAGALVNHELNRKILFRLTIRSHFNTAIRFLLTATLGFFVNIGIIFILVESANIYYLFAQIIATLAVYLITFFINKLWTFQV